MKLNFNSTKIKNNSKYNFEKISITNIYNKSKGSIGKGEYLLPLLFNDVYKEPVFTSGAKGDNYILKGKDKYHLELKAPGSAPYKNFKNPDVKDLKGLQDEIINIFEKYTENQRKNDRDKLYLCFFYEKNFDKKTIKDSNKDAIKDPKGMLFINASKSIDIKKVLEKLIKIDTDIYLSQSDKDFRFAYDGKNILCVVNIKYKNILENADKLQSQNIKRGQLRPLFFL